MNSYHKFYISMALAVSLTACVADQRGKQMVRPMEKMVAPYDNGAIFKAGFNERPLFEERRARNVGDALVMTIAAAPELSKKPVAKDADGKKDAEKDAEKTDKRKTRRERDEELSHIAKDALVGNTPMVVMEVLDSGHLLVSGSKQVIVYGEDKNVRITGVVNPHNIGGDNTVQSTLVSDVRILVDDVRIYSDRTATRFSDGQNIFGNNFQSLSH